MSWNYSGNPSDSELDMYRFLIGDTERDDQVLQDEEIDFVLTTVSDKNARLHLLFNTLVVRYAKTPTQRKLGPQSENSSDRLKTFKQQALFYYNKSTKKGLSVPEYEADIVFSKGMQGNV